MCQIFFLTIMNTITVLDKKFKPYVSEAEILKKVDAVAEKINRDMADKNPLFIAVLKGSFVFAADLMRRLTIPCEISFVRLSSYEGTKSTGIISEVMGIKEDLSNRHIIIVEDIIESGLTMKRMIETLSDRNPASIHICTLLLKPEKLETLLDIDYVAMEIPNDFVLGYGLDYDEQARNLKDLYVLDEE